MSNREDKQRFQSCPGGTGEPWDQVGTACPGFPDKAHRCGRPRQHDDDRPGPVYVHWCGCGFGWISKVYEAARV